MMPDSMYATAELDQLIRSFEALGDGAQKHGVDGANEAGASVLARVKAAAPTLKRKSKGRTEGALRDNLFLQKARVDRNVIAAKVGFTNEVQYATPLELGHKLIRRGNKVGTVSAHPFLRPGADASIEDVITAVAGAINKALEE